jgi:hypothetical protein
MKKVQNNNKRIFEVQIERNYRWMTKAKKKKIKNKN